MPSFCYKLVSMFHKFFPPPLHSTFPPTPRRSRQQRLQPIHRLPPEILSRIFVAAAESDPSDATTDLIPFTLSQVCRIWRLIALHTPALWRRIPIVVVHSNMDGQQNLIHARVLRARSSPLDVCLRPNRAMRVWGWVRPVSQRLDGQNVDRLMKNLAVQAHRWRSFEIEIFSTNAEPRMASAALSSLRWAPRALWLESMKLVFRDNEDATEFYLFSGFAPRLNRLVLDGIRIAWLPTFVGMLTFLDYRHHAFSDGEKAAAELLHALRACPALRELRVLFPDRPALLPPSSKIKTLARPLPAILRRLSSLHLLVDGSEIPRAMLHLLSSLRMPALRTLELVDLARHRKPFPNLRAFQRVCPCSYEVMRITGQYGFAENGRHFVNYPEKRLVHFAPVMRKPHGRVESGRSESRRA